MGGGRRERESERKKKKEEKLAVRKQEKVLKLCLAAMLGKCQRCYHSLSKKARVKQGKKASER